MNCDPLARWYRWLEYAVFGRALEQRRMAFLPEMAAARRVLLLGDGDGRFLAALLRVAGASARIDALDLSAKMLTLARSRAGGVGEGRVYFHCADAREHPFPAETYDLIVTHFFLDCFEDRELARLAERIAQAATPSAVWIVSEFRRPRHPLWGPLAAALISTMYFFFRWAAGLQVRKLPDHTAHLRKCGFQLEREETALGGLAISQLWRRMPAAPSEPPEANPRAEQRDIRQNAQQRF